MGFHCQKLTYGNTGGKWGWSETEVSDFGISEGFLGVSFEYDHTLRTWTPEISLLFLALSPKTGLRIRAYDFNTGIGAGGGTSLYINANGTGPESNYRTPLNPADALYYMPYNNLKKK